MSRDPLKELSKMEGQIHQLNEPVPIEFQKKYIQTSIKEKLSKNIEAFHHYDPVAAEKILYSRLSQKVDKIEALIMLGGSGKVDSFRVLEDFLEVVKPGELRYWALMAQFECKVSIFGNLLDETQVAITSGLGGRDKLMRFMALFISDNLEPFKDFQITQMKEELTFRIEESSGEIEKFKVGPNWLVCTLLYPLKSDIALVIKKFVDECNQYGHFMAKDCLLTNANVIDKEVIDETIRKYQAKRGANSVD